MQKHFEEIPPPWTFYPGFHPMDPFWRQSGEYWLSYVWVPFWERLSSEEKEKYLSRWDVPEEWRCFSAYINPEFAQCLSEIDDDSRD